LKRTFRKKNIRLVVGFVPLAREAISGVRNKKVVNETHTCIDKEEPTVDCKEHQRKEEQTG
jgi:hypothetical protein